jgi:hypothetical protein
VGGRISAAFLVYSFDVSEARRDCQLNERGSFGRRTDVDDETRRIISAWKAEKHEQKAYFDQLEAND